MKLSKFMVNSIEANLKLHINYLGISSGGKYLKGMDKLTVNYSGPRGLALSNMLDDYFKQIGVCDLKEALNRLRNIDNNKKKGLI